MKKLLALVLALVMTLGLATVGANAALKDYSDADSIDADYTEAFAVMNAVGVFMGSDGKLTPTDKLTRAQAAKLIAYLDLGGDVAETLPAKQVFVDVPETHWAAKYVAYCQQAGIIQGAEANKFYPDGELTGYAFGAYLLAVLGYDRTIEGITGPDWQIQAASLMGTAGIGEGVDKAGSVALTREEAAQYCLETLEANVVKYPNKGTTVTAGDTTVQVGAQAYQNETNSTYRNTFTGSKNNDGILQLGEKIYKGKLVLNDQGTDKFGNPSDVWTLDGKAVGTYNNKDAYVTYTAATKASVVKSDLSGLNTTMPKKGSVYVNGVAEAANDTVNNSAIVTAKTTDAATGGIEDLTGNGRIVKVYVDNNAISKVTVTDVLFGQVSAVSDTNKTITIKVLSGTNTGSLTTEEGYGTFAKKDYVVLTVKGSTAPGAGTAATAAGNLTNPVAAATETVVTVAAPKTVSGIASYKNTSDNTITIDGTAYKQSKNVVTANNVANFSVSTQYDATLYLDSNDYILYAKSGAAAAADKSVVVTDIGTTLNSESKLVWMVKGLTSGGESVSWYFGDYGNVTDDANAAALSKGTVYTYTEPASSTGKYALATVSGATTAAQANTAGTLTVKGSSGANGITTSTKTLAIGGETVYLQDSTNFIYVTNAGKSTVLTGAQTVAANTGIWVALKVTNGVYYANAVYINAAAPATTTSSTDVVFVYGSATGDTQVVNSKTGAKENFKTYKAYINGEKVDGFYAKSGATTGFYSVKIDADNGAYIVNGTTAYTATSGTNAVVSHVTASAAKNNILTASSVDYSVGDATYVDLKSANGTSYDTVAEVEDLSAGDLAKLSFYILYNNTGKIASAVYIVDNSPISSATPAASDIEAALATTGTVTLTGTNPTVTGDLTVPEGATLIVDDDFTVTGDLVVEGTIVLASGKDVSGATVTVEGSDASITAEDVTATTSITTSGGAVINATNISAPTVTIGCEVTTEALTADEVTIKGDDATSRLTVTGLMTAVDGTTSNVMTINLLGDSAQLVLGDAADVASGDTVKINVGASDPIAATNAYIDLGANTRVTGTAITIDNIYGASDVTLENSGAAAKKNQTLTTTNVATAGAKLTLAGNNKVTLTSLGEKLDLVLAADSVTTLGGASAVRSLTMTDSGTAVIGKANQILTVYNAVNVGSGATLNVGNDNASSGLTLNSTSTTIKVDGYLNVCGDLTTKSEAQNIAIATAIKTSALTATTGDKHNTHPTTTFSFTASDVHVKFGDQSPIFAFGAMGSSTSTAVNYLCYVDLAAATGLSTLMTTGTLRYSNWGTTNDAVTTGATWVSVNDSVNTNASLYLIPSTPGTAQYRAVEVYNGTGSGTTDYTSSENGFYYFNIAKPAVDPVSIGS